MYPFRRIIIPTDFSTASEWVFDDAIRFAGLTGAELIILHIRMTHRSQPDQLRLPADPSLYQYAEEYELQALRNRVQRANATIPTRLVVRQAPDPGAEVCRAAAGEQADLIVIATHARHHVAHLIIGSTTMNVISTPPAPVLAIRYGTKKRTAFRRFLIPVRPQQTPRAVENLASAMAAHLNAELHLVSVCEKKDHAGAAEHLRELAAALKTPVITTVIEGDDVEKQICRQAEKIDADIIFLNASGEPGPVKRDIIRSAGVPVMIVPDQAAGQSADADS